MVSYFEENELSAKISLRGQYSEHVHISCPRCTISAADVAFTVDAVRSGFSSRCRYESMTLYARGRRDRVDLHGFRETFRGMESLWPYLPSR